jgi:4-hydroxy-tetrahydrodipicolinate synthase
VLQGILPVIPTLLSDRNEIDLPAQRRVIRFALEAGAHGLVFPGVASEKRRRGQSADC